MRLLCCLFLVAATASAAPWDQETLDLLARLPVQEAGRVKPLSTVAKFALLRMNHQSSFRDAEGKKHTALEWMLQVLFRPDDARGERIFLVEDSNALDAIGLEHEGKKRRDRYSYEDLAPGRGRLFQLAHEYDRIDAKERSPAQSQVIDLAHAFLEFEAFHLFDGASALALLPPVDGSKEWLTPRDVVAMALAGHTPAPEHVAMLDALETMARTEDDAEFRRATAEFCGRSRSLANARGEYAKVPLEVSYYKLDSFFWGLVLYVFGFLAVAVTWLWPGKWFARAGFALATAGLAFNTTGIVLRCILRGRPPVSTLYETVIFITAVGVLSALVIEFINRRRIGLAAAPILGAVGLFIASRYEVIDGKDTMPQLLAVLDTNFWLATHVTCITIGYAAGLLAAAIGHVYVLGRIFGLKRGDASFYRNIGRMVYGVILFALFFSVVGTILGGIWANYSWGRFWGWDPKENGALLIVLAQLAMIHGRMGGHLRDFGISWTAILQGCVVAFSWWGVNLLGVGLHSYGFTGGVWTGLLSFYILEGLVLFAGIVGLLMSRSAAPLPPSDSGTAEASPV